MKTHQSLEKMNCFEMAAKAMVPLKVIHVLGNPYDDIATIAMGTSRSQSQTKVCMKILTTCTRSSGGAVDKCSPPRREGALAINPLSPSIK